MEVEPPVATLPDRLPEAVEAAEEAVDAAAEEAAVEEAEPPQAVRAAAAAAAPQTARNERRVIFFIMFSSITMSGSYFPGPFSFLCFPLERLYCTAVLLPLRPRAGKIEVNCLHRLFLLCKIPALPV